VTHPSKNVQEVGTGSPPAAVTPDPKTVDGKLVITFLANTEVHEVPFTAMKDWYIEGAWAVIVTEKGSIRWPAATIASLECFNNTDGSDSRPVPPPMVVPQPDPEDEDRG
jgi:hypothetical protein